MAIPAESRRQPWSASSYEHRRREAAARLLALDAQERELLQDADRQGETARLAAHAEAFCLRVREGLEQADLGRKRELLKLLVGRVIVTGGAVEIRYVVPTGPDGEREPFGRLRTAFRRLFQGLPCTALSPGGRRPMPCNSRSSRR